MNYQKKYYVALLRYCPSYVLGEQVNVGILYFFPDENKADFIFPSKLERLKDLFIDVDIRSIRSFLTYIERSAKNISFEKGIFPETPQQAIDKYFGVRDTVSFFFEPIKQGFYQDIESLQTKDKLLYFKSYYHKTKREQHDEKYLRQTFEKKLHSFSFDYSLLQKKHAIAGINNRSVINFDYSWLNGRLNLIQPLSFDLAEGHSIQDKSLLWFGKLAQIKSTLENEDIKIDFLVSRPQNVSLTKYFDNAIENLNDIGENLFTIIEEEQIDNYAFKIFQHIHK